MKSSPTRLVIAASLSVAAGACSLLGPPVRPVQPPAASTVKAAPALPLPTQTERFVLAPGQNIVGKVQIVRVGKSDTLSDIARRFNVGFEEMVRANPKVDPWLPPVGAAVVVPTQFILPDTPHKGIVVNLAAMRLFYYPPHKRGQPQVVITHPVGIGRRGWKTPQGVTHVMWHEKNPVWHVPPSILAEHRAEGAPLPRVVGPGPDNPLGDYALHLGWPGYLIHGTNKPVSVGLRVSHGCIHLYPEDIKQIFSMVRNGTEVRVVNEPYMFGWQGGRLYMQAFGPLQDDKRPWTKEPRRMLVRAVSHADRAALRQHQETIDWKRVVALVRSPPGVPVSVSGREGNDGFDLAQVLASASRVQNTLPANSTWNGKTDLPLTNAELQQALSQTPPAGSPHGGAGASGSAATPASGRATRGAGAAGAADASHGSQSSTSSDPTGP